MSIARRGLDVAVPEQLADHWKVFAKGQGPGGKAVTKVVNSAIFQLSAPTEAPPRLLKAGRC